MRFTVLRNTSKLSVLLVNSHFNLMSDAEDSLEDSNDSREVDGEVQGRNDILNGSVAQEILLQLNQLLDELLIVERERERCYCLVNINRGLKGEVLQLSVVNQGARTVNQGTR